MGLVEKVVTMAFTLNVVLNGLEFRNKRYGVSASTGKAWMSLVFEDSEGYQVETSVPADLQQDIIDMIDDGVLAKGDMCDCSLKAVARSDGNSYIQLKALPELMED